MKTKMLLLRALGIVLLCLLNLTIYAQTAPAKQWDKRFGGSLQDNMQSIQQTKDGGYILGGYSYSDISGDKTENNQDATMTWADYWIVKTDASGVKQWDKRFGGDESEWLFAVSQTSDDGYILGGYSHSNINGDKTQPNWDISRSTPDYWIVKTDANGNKQWDKRFGGTSWDRLTSLQQTTDGGFILGGESASGIGGDRTQDNRGIYDFWIVKTDANGTKQWDARFGGSGTDYLETFQQTTDSGYILGGWSSSGISGDKTQANWDPTNQTYDYWVVKINAKGVKQWDKRFGGNLGDFLSSVRQTTDGGYILGGTSYSGISGDKTEANRDVTNATTDYWVVKIDAKGVKQWDKRFGGNLGEGINCIKQTTDGGYILGGGSYSGISGDKTQTNRDVTNSTSDFWIVKIDANGVKQWDERFGGDTFDYIRSLQQTLDGEYILAGPSLSGISGDKTQASQGDYDYWIVKLGAASSTCANATNLTTTNITANSAKLNWTAAVNPSKWQIQYKPVITGATWTSVKPGGAARLTTISSLVASQAYKWRIRALCNGTWTVYSATKSFKTLPAAQQLITSSERIKAEKASALRLYPNPSKGSITVQYNNLNTGKVQLKVVDMAGRTIFSSTEAAVHGNNTYYLNLYQLAAGIYNLEVTSYNKETSRVKFVIQK